MSPAPTPQLSDADKNEIRHALLTGNVSAFKNLIEKHKIDPNTEFGQGDTMLHLAVRSGSPEMVATVIEAMPEIDFAKQNRRGNTALCQAVQSAKPNTTKHQDEATRKELRERYTKIALHLIEHDPNIKLTAHLKNLMRKSAFDYLRKSVRVPTIQHALDKALFKQITHEAHITPIPGVIHKDDSGSEHSTLVPNAPSSPKTVRTR